LKKKAPLKNEFALMPDEDGFYHAISQDMAITIFPDGDNEIYFWEDFEALVCRLDNVYIYYRREQVVISTKSPCDEIKQEFLKLDQYSSHNFNSFNLQNYETPHTIDQVFEAFDIKDIEGKKYAISQFSHKPFAFSVLPEDNNYISTRNALHKNIRTGVTVHQRILFCRLNDVYCYYHYGSIFISKKDLYL
jgi:hypothetical protein